VPRTGALYPGKLGSGKEGLCRVHRGRRGRLEVFGRKAGLAFQIVDDVLDMTVGFRATGQDRKARIRPPKRPPGRLSYGIEQSQRDAASLVEEAFCRAGALREPGRGAEVRGAGNLVEAEKTRVLSEDDILTALRDCCRSGSEAEPGGPGADLRCGDRSRCGFDAAWPRQWVKVTMTLTTPQCPASGLILEYRYTTGLAGIPDISRVEVELVWEPKWTPHRISEAGRQQLGI